MGEEIKKPAKLNKQDLTIITLSNNPDSKYYNPEASERYLKQYITLRAEKFNKHGMFYYQPTPDAYDLQQDTLFLLVLDKDQHVVGGRRLIVHEPGTDTKLKTESTTSATIQDMVPHIDVSKMRYGELAGLCFHDTIEGIGFAEDFYRKTFDVTKEMQFDFLVTEAVPRNLARVIKGAQNNGAKQIVPRLDYRSDDGEEDFRTFFCFKSKEELPMLSPEQEAAGIGQPLNDVKIKELITLREAIIAKRSVG